MKQKGAVIDIVIFAVSMVYFVFSLIVMAVGCSYNLGLVLFYGNYVILFLIMLSLVIKGIAKHFLALMFYACFFVFLMGQKLFKPEKNVFLTFIRTELIGNQYLAFLLILFVGIVASYGAYNFCFNRDSSPGKKKMQISLEGLLPYVRILFYITLPMALFMQIKIVVTRSALSYTGSYLINVDIPAIVKIGNYLCDAFLMIYLALKPKKKEMLAAIAIFLFLKGGVQLLQGRRALFACTVLFVIWYLLKYFNVVRIKTKYLWMLVFSCVALVFLFYFVEMQRDAATTVQTNPFKIIERFLISTGGSDSVIANTIAHGDLFPKAGIVYVLDPVINNPISKLLLGKNGIVQGKDFLAAFDDFSHWISYLSSPDLYLSGHGMGSCFLAEAYLALGFPGVFIISICVGKVTSLLENIDLERKSLQNALGFILAQALFTLPRSGVLDWFSTAVYFLIASVFVIPFSTIKLTEKANDNFGNEAEIDFPRRGVNES